MTLLLDKPIVECHFLKKKIKSPVRKYPSFQEFYERILFILKKNLIRLHLPICGGHLACDYEKMKFVPPPALMKGDFSPETPRFEILSSLFQDSLA